jgi:hypothetical protein
MRTWPLHCRDLADGGIQEHGKFSKGKNNSRSSKRSQNPPGETLLTSTLEVSFPRAADFILMLFDEAQGFRDLTRGESMILR